MGTALFQSLPRLIPVRRRWPSTSTSAVTSPPREAEDPVIEQGADAIEFWSEILELLGPDDSALPSTHAVADLAESQELVTLGPRPSLAPPASPLPPLPDTNVASYTPFLRTLDQGHTGSTFWQWHRASGFVLGIL
ncbi:hypothetical protein SPRG_01455 [Saprolegnia parasitica CBS 223.65]|uniref:Uncharacterized protein n=1 Tax=Saprolegnia parasitica (strain CBS 223.65) TaxID=695850 RepID=A0A067CYI7_SAPPC|nr:hypothetical protein SPRG_01455 [Saprolegnia parasitica CBS 223.65]KDO34320.1 hypothetical protein SPRG_01455 [Saprolegnia parasitica CBS 223.65]|eukprot:XP_012195057.1 hypothetical protein SPRG_01455 [Saprolegnia parasitica CBS 223.65]